jgi:hypothetical protein
MQIQAVTHNFTLDQGATLEYEFEVTNPDGSPYDFTGHTVRSQMRQTFSSSIAFNLNPTIDGNKIILNMTDAQSSAISILNNSITDYVYDVEIINASSVVWKFVRGVIKVTPEATK